MSGCTQQRMGWLLGYYSEDPNYPDGVRVNVEALYEPPQFGDFHSFTLLEDENQGYVDMLCEALTLEKVGFVFTSTYTDGFISPDQMKLIAEMQEKYSVRHPEGIKVSKFVSVIIKVQGDLMENTVDAYMVSDQC